jgi:hypothetical protein
MSKASTVKEKSAAPDALNGNSASISDLLQQCGCGPIPFVGRENAFYERASGL